MRLKIPSVVYISIGSFICGVMFASIIPPHHQSSWWELLAVLIVTFGVAASHLWPDTTRLTTTQKEKGK